MRTPWARALLPATRCQSSGPLGALLSSPALDVRLPTALQVLQVRLVLVETLGGIAPPTKQFLHVFAKEAVGTNTDRTVYGAASASASSFVVHHTQQISMAAVAGDADNINKQARKERTDGINKQNEQASGERFLVLGPSGGCPRRAQQTGPSTLPVSFL